MNDDHVFELKSRSAFELIEAPYYDCDPDAELLDKTSVAEALDNWLEHTVLSLSGHIPPDGGTFVRKCIRDNAPATVYAFAPMRPDKSMANGAAEAALDWAMEAFEEEYGDPEGIMDPGLLNFMDDFRDQVAAPIMRFLECGKSWYHEPIAKRQYTAEEIIEILGVKDG